ncbi:G8 domain-containing protein DDB_G0286311-like [Eupeodes corollae]|uniref:G8 domain-containing protein DDB_G0286311-like n=1 Tax=Eupeodes corollae TaxID=290404 RepID=UPI00248F6E20|nr:G8 domain-containing protein DDB_G0286311-like [Eupeodes corollae]
MLIGDFCLKIYLWPYLSYLANLKGLCSSYYANNPALFPIITLPPGVTLAPTVPTFQPTPATQPTVPTVRPTLPTTLTPTTIPTTIPTTATTLPANCPAFPVVCLPGGIRPNPNCPCIDPRFNNAVKRQAGPVGSEMMVFSSLNNRRKRKRRSVFKN